MLKAISNLDPIALWWLGCGIVFAILVVFGLLIPYAVSWLVSGECKHCGGDTSLGCEDCDG